jgi:hypothetical protein
VLHAIASWWDGLELWIAELPFGPQVVLILGVMIPVSYLIATGLDRVVHLVLDRMRSLQHGECRAAEDLPGVHDRRNGVN